MEGYAYLILPYWGGGLGSTWHRPPFLWCRTEGHRDASSLCLIEHAKMGWCVCRHAWCLPTTAGPFELFGVMLRVVHMQIETQNSLKNGPGVGWGGGGGAGITHQMGMYSPPAPLKPPPTKFAPL